jgi:hypothetical protein
MNSIIKNMKTFVKSQISNKNWLSIFETKEIEYNKNLKIENDNLNNYKPSHYDELLEEMGKNGGL